MSSKTVWQKAARRLQQLTGCSYQYALNLVQTPSVKIEANKPDRVGSFEDALVKAASEKVET